MITAPRRSREFIRRLPLSSRISSAVVDIDATIPASSPGTGTTVFNIGKPANGELVSDSNFVLGDGSTSTTFPTFTGSAGSRSAYYLLDGGDYFKVNDMATADLIRQMHRTDQTGVWVAMAFRYKVAAATQWLWSSTHGADDLGFGVAALNADSVAVQQSNGTLLELNTLYAGGTLLTDTDYLLILSWNGSATTNNLRGWLNSRTKVESSYNLEDTTTDSDEMFRIGAGSDGGAATLLMENGTRVYSFAAGNEFIDDAGAAKIINHLNRRHGRTYA